LQWRVLHAWLSLHDAVASAGISKVAALHDAAQWDAAELASISTSVEPLNAINPDGEMIRALVNTVDEFDEDADESGGITAALSKTVTTSFYKVMLQHESDGSTLSSLCRWARAYNTSKLHVAVTLQMKGVDLKQVDAMKALQSAVLHTPTEESMPGLRIKPWNVQHRPDSDSLPRSVPFGVPPA
jgi:hypothetical protein